MTSEAVSNQDTKEYRVRPGMKHYARTKNGNIRFEGGQIVTLTIKQYNQFKDKFIPTEQTADQIEKTKQTAAQERYVIQDAGGKKFNVYDTAKRELQNDRPMAKSEVEVLKKKLDGAGDK